MCPFCEKKQLEIIFESKLIVVFKDKFPVSKGHLLIIPKRHVETPFDLTKKEWGEYFVLLKKARHYLIKQDGRIEGFNIGINSGRVAGQTVFHCHIHLIPRRKKDVKNPQGGVRAVIAGKQIYNEKK